MPDRSRDRRTEDRRVDMCWDGLDEGNIFKVKEIRKKYALIIHLNCSILLNLTILSVKTAKRKTNVTQLYSADIQEKSAAQTECQYELPMSPPTQQRHGKEDRRDLPLMTCMAVPCFRSHTLTEPSS